jgi:hypothetical protein
MRYRLRTLLTPALLFAGAVVITVGGAAVDSNAGAVIGACFLVAAGVALKRALAAPV